MEQCWRSVPLRQNPAGRFARQGFAYVIVVEKDDCWIQLAGSGVAIAQPRSLEKGSNRWHNSAARTSAYGDHGRSRYAYAP